MSARGADLINDAIATNPPAAVVTPHGRNSFAMGDGAATEDPSMIKRLSVDVRDIESSGDRSQSIIDAERYPPPTAEEAATLRKVSDSIPLIAYSLCIVELAERASYYGVQTIFSNFMQFPLPEGGNGAGAPAKGSEDTVGALGRGEQFSVAIGLLFSFLAYVIPVFGGYGADVYTGRYRMIMYGVLLCGVSHVIMICGAIPTVLKAGNGIAPFMISLIILAIGAGVFKPCVALIVIDQYTHQRAYTKTLKSGEKVVVDPEVTIQRLMLAFYACVNVGAFFAIATTYSEKYVGYWLAFLLPGIVYFLLPILLLAISKHIIKKKPSGSALQNVVKICAMAIKQTKGQFWKKGFWQSASPKVLREKGITTFNGKPITWTEKSVDDVVRTVKACAIFLYFPIYNINDGGIGSVATSQGAAMTTNGAPNDLLSNFNPLTIIAFIPILSYVLYPALRKYNIKFGRITRITVGFAIACLSGMCGAIVQYYIYKTSP
ncbi:hypothetical protein AAFC00_000704 [Neodothiora populina]|uniref:Peptide transporter PTR2 n=1 Tax=Neodothiora populina TaxID=2781224 RepID=A0ABR3PF01_9PEZI